MKIRKKEQGMGSIVRAQAAKLTKRVVRVRLRAQGEADDVQKRPIHQKPSLRASWPQFVHIAPRLCENTALTRHKNRPARIRMANGGKKRPSIR